MISERTRNLVRITAFTLHAIGALGVTFVSFLCKHIDERTQWATGLAIEHTPECDASPGQCFRGGTTWRYDQPVSSMGFNPFALILAFEWISGGFALYYLDQFKPGCKTWALGWIGVGGLVFFGWHVHWVVYPSSEIFIGLLSFTLAILVLMSYESWALSMALDIQAYYASRNPASGGRLMQKSMISGRLWVTPVRIAGLLGYYEPNNKSIGYGGEPGTSENLLGGLEVILRFTEYVITAPLLYLAVFGLLVQDAPNWMYISGYAMIQTCNFFGLLLQYTVVNDSYATWGIPERNAANTAYWEHALILMGLGTWRTPWVNKIFYMEGAWAGMLMGLGVIMYAARGVLLNQDIPWFVLAGIWNLLVTFMMFGVIPTILYLRGSGMDVMDITLDILSVAAKFPEAMFVVFSFIIRPVGQTPCFT